MCCVLRVPAASPQEAADRPGPGMTRIRSRGPCQTQRVRSTLHCQPHFSPPCFPIRVWNDRTSLCLRFLRDSRSGREEKKKKNSYLSHSIHYHTQTVQTATCKWDHTPARELAQRCFSQSAVCSHSWSSTLRSKKCYSYQKVYW